MESVLYFSDLEWAILQTIAYADIFDYPLTSAEIQRYLINFASPLDDVKIASRELTINYLSEQKGLFCLKGRESILETRQDRAEVARDLWPKAQYYGQLIGAIPFVRMVAVTGSLAVNNTGANSDIDYLIVTKPQYLWLCRMFIIGLVKWVQWRYRDTICPNYLITENALVISKRDLFVARELVQMIPIYGLNIYDTIRRLNDWSSDYFPNAEDTPIDRSVPLSGLARWRKRVIETLLQNPFGRWIDKWEMKRKIRKLAQLNDYYDEAGFSPDYCKGHFDGHKQHTLTALNDRLQMLRDKQKNLLMVNSQ